MYLQTTDLIAIMIALVGSCTMMVVSIMSHRQLLMMNKELQRTIRILKEERAVELTNALRKLKRDSFKDKEKNKYE